MKSEDYSDIHKETGISVRAALALSSGLAAFFLAGRFRAFLVQAWGFSLPGWWDAVLTVLIAGLCAFFSGPCLMFLRRYAGIGSYSGVFICGFSLALILPLEWLVVERAVEGSEVAAQGLVSFPLTLGAGFLLSLFNCCIVQAIRDRLPDLKRFILGCCWKDAVLLLLLFAGGNLAVWLYSTGSFTIYYGDSAGYWTTASMMAEILEKDGLGELIHTILDSVLTNDYNYLIAVAATITAQIFGDGHGVYLLTVFNFYYLPICVLVWAAAKAWKIRLLYLCVPAALLALPVMFMTALEGFIDVGGCVFTLAALLLWFSDGRENRFGDFLLAGYCLALGLLMRRWYAFFALSYVLALVIDCAVFRRNAVPVVATLAGFGFPVLFYFQPMVSGLLLKNYSSIYTAFDLGLRLDYSLFAFRFGIIILAVLGLTALWLLTRRGARREQGVFLLSQAVICFVLFVNVQTHGQQHLLLYMPCFLCLSLLGMSEISRYIRSDKALAAVLLVSIVPSLSPLKDRPHPSGLTDLGMIYPLPSFSWKPPYNPYVSDYLALCKRIDEFGAEEKQVALLSMSFALNRSLLLNAEKSVGAERNPDVDRRRWLVELPEVDERDGWWNTIFWCEILAVPDPIQAYMGPENMSVITIPAEDLLNGVGFAENYQKLDEVWQVTDDIKVYFYEKVVAVPEEQAEEMRSRFFALHPNALYNGEPRDRAGNSDQPGG